MCQIQISVVNRKKSACNHESRCFVHVPNGHSVQNAIHFNLFINITGQHQFTLCLGAKRTPVDGYYAHDDFA